jgi:hypothetical protein
MSNKDARTKRRKSMRCEHGNEIIVSSVYDIDKDCYNKEGNIHKQDDKESYLLIYGCDKCRMIEVNFDNSE